MSDKHHNAGEHHGHQRIEEVKANSHEPSLSHDNHHTSQHDTHHPAESSHNSPAAPEEKIAPFAAVQKPLEIKLRPIRLPIAKESWLFIVPLLVVVAICWSLGLNWTLITIAFFIGYIVFFFRDVERLSPQDPSFILAPADGKVIEIKKITEKNFLKEECYCVSIFMSLFDNHINRLPVEGKIVHQEHKNGEWLAADSEEAAERNEQNAIGIESKKGNILLVQVAGLVARRIVSRVNVGDELKQGQRFGLIMFGSRVDVYLPAKKIALEVKKGQRVYSGLTVIGIYND